MKSEINSTILPIKCVSRIINHQWHCIFYLLILKAMTFVYLSKCIVEIVEENVYDDYYSMYRNHSFDSF